MNKKLLTLALSVLWIVLTQNVFAAKHNGNIQIKVNGKQRTYKLYVPDNVQESAPLVFSLHGTGGSCEWGHPEFNTLADQNGFIVVYPSGLDVYYPEFGSSMPGWQATGTTSDDTDFLLNIIEDVNKRYTVDRKRIYCCGFSNGGMMTYTVACALRDTFAAFASISGFPIESMHLHQSSSKPFPFLHIHGKADDFVMYSKLSIIVDNVVARNGCVPIAPKENVSGSCVKSVYAATEGSFPYILYEVAGMGHESETNATEDGNSATTMWKFMSQYRLDDVCDATLKWRPNIEQSRYNPKSHGWTMNSDNIIASFGKEQYTTSNKNIYHSLQLTKDNYKLSFHVALSSDQNIGVKLQKLTGDKSVVFEKSFSVSHDDDLEIYFSTTDNWAEYNIEFTRSDTESNVKLSKIEIHTTEETGIAAPAVSTALPHYSGAYDLNGRRVSPDSKGVVIVDGKKRVNK